MQEALESVKTGVEVEVEVEVEFEAGAATVLCNSRSDSGGFTVCCELSTVKARSAKHAIPTRRNFLIVEGLFFVKQKQKKKQQKTEEFLCMCTVYLLC